MNLKYVLYFNITLFFLNLFVVRLSWSKHSILFCRMEFTHRITHTKQCGDLFMVVHYKSPGAKTGVSHTWKILRKKTIKYAAGNKSVKIQDQ